MENALSNMLKHYYPTQLQEKMDILYTKGDEQSMAAATWHLWQEPARNDRNVVLHIDEIAQYQTGRYISGNEAVWRILSFFIYERSLLVVDLTAHLENGQRIYFIAAAVQQIALNPPTKTAFFTLCQKDLFAKTLLYSEVPTCYTLNVNRKSLERRKRGEPVILDTQHQNNFLCSSNEENATI
ncbi:unnamed protein product [Onchocerca ochengi]|uniref:DNA helicase n=1 Tax=Onchocerca ochengi TaxID=42157 RepID=A0A182EHL9_ONCOC|nr:unnamed protein product [Onchocerca ochengi]